MQTSEDANIVWNEGLDATSLAENLAGELVVQIGNAIAEKGRAVIALSGGSTPKPLFNALADHSIDWEKVIVTLVDERWVPESHELSNAAFMKQNLLNALPVGTRFVPLYQAAQTVEASFDLVLADYREATATQSALNSVHDSLSPFDVVILGMGGDGHTASFFPDAKNIRDLVDIDADQPLLTCHSPSTQVERITWSLPTLLNTTFLALHFTGSGKLDVFEKAMSGGATEELPIRSAIFQTRTPLNVYYAD